MSTLFLFEIVRYWQRKYGTENLRKREKNTTVQVQVQVQVPVPVPYVVPWWYLLFIPQGVQQYYTGGSC